MSFLTHLSKRLSSNSLFIRLLAGFLIVIVFFASLNLLSLTFFKSMINQQITEYNRLNIRNTTQNYDSRIDLVKGTIYNLLFSDPVTALHVEMVKENKINYYSTSQVVQEINFGGVSKIRNDSRFHRTDSAGISVYSKILCEGRPSGLC